MKRKTITTLLFVMILMLAVFGTAAGEVITPLQPQIDLSNLNDRFITTNIEYKGNNMMTLTLYENEQFDADAIRSVNIGDIILSDGEELPVKSIEWDGPDLYFNRNTEDEVLFCDTTKGTFERIMEDDMVPQVKLGSLEQEVLPYMVMLDWVDAETGDILDNVAVRNGDELLALLESGNGPSFSVFNVRILYNDYQPMLIWRFYSPAQ
ncbi:MAG: hypothetical protein IJ242_17745 [Clostridia bacterium]|nr:hypothetical protein [Clostridia bacterium]